MQFYDQHPPWRRVLALPAACLISLFSVAAGLAAQAEPLQLPTIAVNADQQRSDVWQPVGNSSRLTEQEISHTSAVHAAELLNQLPGVWISRGNGQESLTAIRSPVLTGPGTCGAFLVLENGIPIRPAGFCNVNNLFEIDYEQAGEIEVIRGPASALYGGNALHGVINVRNAQPDPAGGQLARLEAGEHDFGRLLYSNNIVADESLWRVDYLGAHDGGWRDDSGYDQQKLVLQHHRQIGSWQANGQLTGTWLEQETAGYIFGEDAYKKAG
ncbi:MAG: TonB-dependent receptor, partial [Gammaproteobacteria bacterium]